MMDNVKLKQCPVDKWTTREKLCLTSAVLQSGDQNWGAVSRAIRQLTTETGRPPDWYSTKNCALQYAKLLEQVEIPKRKREKGEGPLNETPDEIVSKMLSEKRVEELKGILEEEKASYHQLRKEILHLESHQLDNRLHQFWEEIMREQEAEEEEALKLQEFLKEREEKIKIFQAASKVQAAKAQPVSTYKKNVSSVKISGNQVFKKPNSSEAIAAECPNMEEGMETEQSLSSNNFVSPALTSASLQNTSSIKNSFTSDKGTCDKTTEEVKTPEKNFSSQVKQEAEDDDEEEEDEGVEDEEEDDGDDDEEEEADETIKMPEEVLEDLKCDVSFETNITLDYTSNLNVEMKDQDQDITPEDAKKLIDVTELIKEHLEGDEKSEENKSAKEPIQVKSESEENESGKAVAEEKKPKVENDVVTVKEDIDEDRNECEIEKREERVKEEEKDEEEEENDDDEEEKTVCKGEEEETIKYEKTKGRRVKGPHSFPPKDDTKAKVEPDAIIEEEESSSESRAENNGKITGSVLDEVMTVVPPGGSPLCEKEAEKRPPKKESRDEYDFDDDASRESMEVKEFMNRGDKRKFSLGDNVSSPVVSESTPSSPASTSYGDDPEAEKMHRSWKRSIMLLWNDIAAHKNASLFLKPITEDKVPGYHSIVFRPIDLMTIKRSIENGTIRATNDFYRDIMLMLLNAKMYNPRDNDIYRMAEHMMNDAVEIIEEFISAQMLAKVVETPQKTLRRETRESSAKRVVEDLKRKRGEREEKAITRRKI